MVCGLRGAATRAGRWRRGTLGSKDHLRPTAGLAAGFGLGRPRVSRLRVLAASCVVRTPSPREPSLDRDALLVAILDGSALWIVLESSKSYGRVSRPCRNCIEHDRRADNNSQSAASAARLACGRNRRGVALERMARSIGGAAVPLARLVRHHPFSGVALRLRSATQYKH